MPRLRRVHVPGALYYVIHRRNRQRAIFESLSDYVLYESIVARALEQFGVCVHAFCWRADEIHLALQVGALPLSRFMRAVASRYARALHLPKRARQPLFQSRFEALLIDDQHLLKLIRYIHRLPDPRDGERPALKPCSSDGAYRQRTPLPWLTTDVALQRFSHLCVAAVAQYEAFMDDPAPAVDPRHFIKRPVRDPRIVGDSRFAATLPWHLRIDRNAGTVEDIIQAVLLQEGLSREELTRTRATRAGVVARALVTFHAVELGVASYSELSRTFNNIGIYALKRAVQRYRDSQEYGHLFVVGALDTVSRLIELVGDDSPSRSH